MANEKQNILFYRDWYNMIQTCQPEQKLELYDTIMRYAFENKECDNPALSLVFNLIKQRIDANEGKWESIKTKRSEAGKKHKGNQYTRASKQKEQMEQVSQIGTNGTNGTDNVNDNGLPSLQEVKHCIEDNSLHTNTQRTREEFSETEEAQARWFAKRWNEIRKAHSETRTAQFTTLTSKRKRMIVAIIREYSRDGVPRQDLIERGIRNAMTSEKAQGKLKGQPAPADLNFMLERFPELVEKTF